MQLRYHSLFLTHDTGQHPENPRRLQVLADHFKLSDAPLDDGEEFLELIHPPDYIESIRQYCAQGKAIDADTVVVPASYRAATHAVGLTMAAAYAGEMALVRPPGHHAHRHKAHGFCLFNNLAIAVEHMAREGKRVAILDFDGHLGDGTESIFYDYDNVLFWSTHQYPAFPFEGFVDHIGAGKGQGYTINVPLPPGAGDDVFLDALQLFWPILKAFGPDVIAISAGFDAYQFDPLLNLNFSLHAFYEVGRKLHEEFLRLSTREMRDHFNANPVRGEFVLLLEGKALASKRQQAAEAEANRDPRGRMPL